MVEALRVQALLATRQRRWGEAKQALEEGMLLAQAMPYPYAEARLLQVDGQMHIEQGDPQRAREQLEKAATIFRRLGAKKDIERIEQTLTTLALPR